MKELLEKYPKAAKLVNEYYLNKLLESLNDKSLPEEFKEEVRAKGLPVEQIVQLLEVNPAALIDVFDSNEIYIDIDVHIIVNGIADDVKFSFKIPGWDTMEEIGYKTRKEAEKEAIKECFEILEKRL